MTYMRALSDGGVLSVTLWNKEEPPKSVLKLYATMAAAARERRSRAYRRDSFFVASTYLSTATVLYKRGGFTADEIAKLRKHTHAMSFDEIYSPGLVLRRHADRPHARRLCRADLFGRGGRPGRADRRRRAAERRRRRSDRTRRCDRPSPDAAPAAGATTASLPATTMGRLAWHSLIDGGWPAIAKRYVFDTRPLTNDRPISPPM